MKTDLSFLPEHKQAELKAIVDVLINRQQVEMIILFGSHARGKWVEDKYLEDGITYEYLSDYDLLVILAKNSLGDNDVFMNTLTEKLDALNFATPINPIFDGIDFVNQSLQEGNYFFGDIKKEGILLYTTNKYQLDEKRDMNPEERRAIAQEDFDHWFESADDFFRIAKSELNIDKYKTAVFNLHQTVERYYAAIQLVFIGYKPKTHDLAILERIVKVCHIDFGQVFPKRSKQERDLFLKLKQAYVDARYKCCAT